MDNEMTSTDKGIAIAFLIAFMILLISMLAISLKLLRKDYKADKSDFWKRRLLWLLMSQNLTRLLSIVGLQLILRFWFLGDNYHVPVYITLGVNSFLNILSYLTILFLMRSFYFLLNTFKQN